MCLSPLSDRHGVRARVYMCLLPKAPLVVSDHVITGTRAKETRPTSVPLEELGSCARAEGGVRAVMVIMAARAMTLKTGKTSSISIARVSVFFNNFQSEDQGSYFRYT